MENGIAAVRALSENGSRWLEMNASTLLGVADRSGARSRRSRSAKA